MTFRGIGGNFRPIVLEKVDLVLGVCSLSISKHIISTPSKLQNKECASVQ